MNKSEQIKEIIDLDRLASRHLRRFTPDTWMALTLTMSQLKSLFYIDSEGSTNSTGLATALGVTTSNMTGIVDRLVEQGLVTREGSPEDRRVHLLKVTEKGGVLLADLRERRNRRMSEVLSSLGEEDLRLISRALTILARAAEEITYTSHD